MIRVIITSIQATNISILLYVFFFFSFFSAVKTLNTSHMTWPVQPPLVATRAKKNQLFKGGLIEIMSFLRAADCTTVSCVFFKVLNPFVRVFV